MFGVVQDMPAVTEAEYHLVEKHLGPDRTWRGRPPPRWVLDVGCGTGATSFDLGRAVGPTWFRGADENPWLPLVVLGAAPFVNGLPPLPLPGEPGPFRFR
jgi:hypothetical protein